MVSSTSRAIAAILIIFSSALYAHSQTGLAAKAPTATISGKVTIKGKGAPGVVVGLRLIDKSTPVHTKAVTDDQGNYKILNVPPGYYQVVAVAPVYVPTDDPGRGKTVLINKDETVENVDIALVRGGVITGKVTDSDGRPAIEEEISVYPVETNKPFFFPTLGIRTDDRGVYRIFGLPAGNYRVAPGLKEDGAFGRRTERASYKLTYHPAAADISQASIVEVTEGSEATNVDIALGRFLVKYSARGRIVDGVTGWPVANVKYGLHMTISETSSGSMSTGAASNSEGEFKFQNLAPGKYAVYIDPEPASEWRADAVPFDVIDQDVAGLIVRMVKGASVSGVMVLEGTDDAAVQASLSKVLLHAIVSVDSPNVSSPSPSTNIVQNGNFRISGLKAGTLRFALTNDSRFQIVRVERDGIFYPKGIGIKEGEQLSGVRVVVNYGNGTIRGTVKPESGTFPQNTSMYITLRRLGMGEQPDSGSHSTRVDTRGQFLIEGLLPGNYEVSAAVFVNDARIPVRHTRQQVVVTDGSTTNVTLTVDLSSTPNRP